MFNHLVQNVLANCMMTQIHGTSPSSKTHDKSSNISLGDSLNANKYSFFVTVTAPSIPNENTVVKDSTEIIEENSFVIKEFISYISNFKKSKDIPSLIIYDKTNEYKINDELAGNLPNNVPVFNITTKLLQIQEASLLRCLNVSRHFSIALIERLSINNFEIINTVCHNILKADNVPQWPWKYSNIEFIFKEKMVKPINGEIVKQKNMHKKAFNVKGIYFFNWMIPLCRSFTSTLREFYENMQRKYGKENFEIFGCMFDQEKYNDENVFKSMPWCTLKCSKEILDRIKYTLGVFHVPSLVLLDENNDIITRNGRWLISSDQNCEKLNWNQWKWDVQNPIAWNSIRPWNFYLLWEMPSLIIFGDSDDETYIDEWMIAVGQMQFTNLQNQCLKTKNLQLNGKNLTKNQFINGSAMLLFKCIDDDEFLIHYGLADLGVPLAVIFDPFIGVSICEEEAMSAEILTKFLDDYLKGKISPTIAAIPKSSSSTVTENVSPQEIKPILLLGETNNDENSDRN